MARRLGLAEAGSTTYSTGSRIAAVTAGAAMVLASLVATTASATEGPAVPGAAGGVSSTGTLRKSAPERTSEDGPVVLGLIVEYSGSSSRLSNAASAAGSLGKKSQVTLRGEDRGVIEFAEPTDLDTANEVRKRVERLPGVTSVDYNIRHTAMAAPPGGVPADEFFGNLHGIWDMRDSVTLTDSHGNANTFSLPAGGYGTHAPSLWRLTKGSKKVTVAVIDTGRTAHPDLDANTVAGYDMISGPIHWEGVDYFDPRDGNGRDADPADEGDWYGAYACGGTSPDPANSSWHGTHVAGTIAARADSLGVVGNAPGVQIQHVRVLGKCGGSTEDIADGITWASGGKVSGLPRNATPAKVLNLSLGGEIACQSVTQKAINGARKRGSVVIVSAGNFTDDARKFQPANCKNVITVGATDLIGTRAGYSNFGPAVDLSAPGGDFGWGVAETGIFSTLNAGTTAPAGPKYEWYNGTSMAAPAVSGVAALIASLRPKLSAAQLEKAIRGSVSKFPNQTALGDYNCAKTKVCGKGLIDAKRAATAWYSTPKVSGAAVGKKAKVSTPVVSNKSKFKYQWLRDGKKIKGATKKTYTVKKGDLGKKLSVKVTASLSGFYSKSATSKKVKVSKQSPSVSAKLAKSTIKKSKKAKLKIVVKAGALTKKPTGTLKVTFGKKSKSYSLKASKKGKLTVTLPKLKRGTYKIKVRYTPAKTYKKYVKAKTSKTVKLTVR